MKNSCRSAMICLGVLCLLASACGVSILPVGEPSRISVDRLKKLMEEQEVVIVDVRHDVFWSESSSKIPGAIRGDDKSVTWARQYEKDTRLVLYCA